MTTLIFKNKKLQGILRITEQATSFNASFSESVEAYEKETGTKYKIDADLSKFGEHHKPTLWLVKDQGIYLMTSAKLEKLPDDYSHVCYAEGFEPDAPGWWEKCRAAVGGDDFVESFHFTSEIKEGIMAGADIQIKIGPAKLIVGLLYP